MMWYINYFHVQILVIELLFCLHLEKKSHFWLRFVPGAALYLALPLAVPGGFFNPHLVLGGFTLGFLAMCMLSGLLLWFCFCMNVRQVVFYCCVAHTFQHMIHCLYRMFCLVFSPPFWVGQGIQFGLLIVACVLVYRLLSHRFRGSETADFGNNYLLLFAFVSTLTIYVVSYWTTSQECETIGIQFFDFFSCLLLVTILLDIFRIRQAEREQMVMERLLRQEIPFGVHDYPIPWVLTEAGLFEDGTPSRLE